MLKQWRILFLTFVMALALLACGDNHTPTNDDDNPKKPTSSVESTTGRNNWFDDIITQPTTTPKPEIGKKPSETLVMEDVRAALAEENPHAEMTGIEIVKSLTDETTYKATLSITAQTNYADWQYSAEIYYTRYDQGWIVDQVEWTGGEYVLVRMPDDAAMTARVNELLPNCGADALEFLAPIPQVTCLTGGTDIVESFDVYWQSQVSLMHGTYTSTVQLSMVYDAQINDWNIRYRNDEPVYTLNQSDVVPTIDTLANHWSSNAGEAMIISDFSWYGFDVTVDGNTTHYSRLSSPPRDFVDDNQIFYYSAGDGYFYLYIYFTADATTIVFVDYKSYYGTPFIYDMITITGDIVPNGHIYDQTKWSYDSYSHWHRAACGCEVYEDLDYHSDADNDERCDICDNWFHPYTTYTVNVRSEEGIPLVNIVFYISGVPLFGEQAGENITESAWTSAWEILGTGHITLPLGNYTVRTGNGKEIPFPDGETEVTITLTCEHVDDDNDGWCDACNWTDPDHTHTFAWVYDDVSTHRRVATCGHNVYISIFDEYAPHCDNDTNNECDDCSASVDTYTIYVVNYKGEPLDNMSLDFGDFGSSLRTDSNGCVSLVLLQQQYSVAILGNVCLEYVPFPEGETELVLTWLHDHDHVDATNADGFCDLCGYKICVHIDQNLDGDCDICGWYDPNHTHEIIGMAFDETYHWYTTSCHPGAMAWKTEHSYEESTGECFEYCGYTWGHIHTYETEWSYDTAEHWRETTCGHGTRYWGNHCDEDGNLKCDECNADMAVYTVYIVDEEGNPLDFSEILIRYFEITGGGLSLNALADNTGKYEVLLLKQDVYEVSIYLEYWGRDSSCIGKEYKAIVSFPEDETTTTIYVSWKFGWE